MSASASSVRAGEAFVEVTLRNKTQGGMASVASAMSRMAAFARVLSIGLAVASAAAVAVGAAIAKSVGMFAAVGVRAREIGAALHGVDVARAVKLSEALNTLGVVVRAVGVFIGEAFAGPAKLAINIAILWGIELVKVAKAFSDVANGAFIAVSGIMSLAPATFVAFSGIIAAIAMADVPKAFQMMGKAIELAWDGTMVAIQNSTIEAFNAIFKLFEKAFTKLAKTVSGLEEAIGALTGTKVNLGSGALFGVAGAIGGLGSGVNAALQEQLRKMLEELLKDIADLGGAGADARRRLRLRLGSLDEFNRAVGGLSPGSGSAAGTFSGRAAGSLGIGPGGGIKVSDEKGHDLLARVIKAIEKIFAGAKFE